MISKKLIIQNNLGLHARAAAKIVDLADRFAAEITVLSNGQKASGKSIMDLMLLAAKKNDEVELIVNGKDETAALAALEKLINEKFGETE